MHFTPIVLFNILASFNSFTWETFYWFVPFTVLKLDSDTWLVFLRFSLILFTVERRYIPSDSFTSIWLNSFTFIEFLHFDRIPLFESNFSTSIEFFYFDWRRFRRLTLIRLNSSTLIHVSFFFFFNLLYFDRILVEYFDWIGLHRRFSLWLESFLLEYFNFIEFLYFE
jgi:hypothetical protein